MCFKNILVVSFCLSLALSSPLPESQLYKAELQPTSNGTEQELTDTTKKTLQIPDLRKKELNDLTGQETFYPSGGVWWNVRPWGGWGGYRPWYGWHGWHGWHGPQWGGHWGGGGWGGHLGSGRWGRTS